MLITAYYEIYGKPERVPQYFEWFRPLGHSGIPIIVFVDPKHVDLFTGYPTTVRVIPRSLDTFELYQMGMKYTGDLPRGINKEKDTQEFLSFMNTKIEIIKEAMNYWDGDTFLWIDFGILKIVKEKEKFLDTLKATNDMAFDNIIIPGCWAANSPFSVDYVHWRFCGGFAVLPRTHIQSFYEHCKDALHQCCTMPPYKLSWEVNTWTIVERSHPNTIHWYCADHNDTIVTNIHNYLSTAN